MNFFIKMIDIIPVTTTNVAKGEKHMQTVKTTRLKEGMVTATPVKTKHGQLIVDDGITLTDQLIARISFYGIEYIKIESDSELEETSKPKTEAAPVPKNNVKEPTYSQRVKKSPEFQTFQLDHSVSTNNLKDELAPLLSKSGNIDTNALFEIATPLLSKATDSIEMFDMLHNMRAVDDSIYAHSLNVALIAGMFGKWLKMSQEDLNVLILAALLHDVGKAQIPTEILNKPDKYTDEEFALVKQHPTFGYQILDAIPDSRLDPRIKKAALMHHERSDGTGYPQGLKGDAIDDFAQIIAIADVYDAMTAARSYRAPLCPFQVIAAFEKDGLQKYHPKFILTFLEHIAITYQRNRVLLSDGRGADIIMLNKQTLSRPVVQVDDGTCIDLSHTPELSIQSLL